MSNNANQFQITVDQYPRLAIRGERFGALSGDGLYTYNLEVTSDGLHVNIRKTIAPGEIQSFVEDVRRMQDASREAPLSTAHLRSWGVHDFDLLIEGDGRYCKVTFRLRHGNENGWAVDFSMQTPAGKVAVESSDPAG